MNLSTAMTQVWEALGEPSDLNPAKSGVTKLRDAINDAQDVVAMWIADNGRKVMFRELEDRLQVTTVVEAGTLEAGQPSPYKVVTMPAALAANLGRFVDWVLTVGNESRKVVVSAVTGGRNVLTLSSGFTVDPSSTAYVLSKPWYQFSGTDAVALGGMRIAEIQRIVDLETGTELEEAAGRDYLIDPVAGDPGSWRHDGKGFRFDSAPQAARKYDVCVTRYPALLEDQTDEIGLPDAFAQAVVLRAVWWGFRRLQDFQAAYATKLEFKEMMTRLATSATLNGEPDYFTLRSR